MGGNRSRFQINALCAFLQGEWNLERRVQDHRVGHDGRLTGAAVFLPQEGGLLYREEGRFSIGEHEGPALQSYRYAFPSLARAEVSFSDGRFFHDLDLTAGTWRCTHLCGDDRYDGDFAALGADVWRVVWTVKGTRKDLVLDSTYRRRL